MDLFESWIVKQRIAHRGLHNNIYPENTLGAFKNAIANGFAVEMDVRMTGDGTLIVFHDDTLGRMTNKDGYVSTLKKQNLSELRVGKSDQSVPTLDEALELINGQVPILLEIKNQGNVGVMENALIERLNRYNGDFAVMSFNPLTIEYFKNNAPHFYRGQLSCHNTRNLDINFFHRRALAHMKHNKFSCPHFIAYDLHDLPDPYVGKYRQKLPILAYVVKSNDDFERVKTLVDNIIFENKIPLN